MKNKILNLIDFEKVNILLEGFNKSTGFVTAILDLDGNVLSQSGWRQICTKYHRVHPETATRCTESDTLLAGEMAAGEKYHCYKCLNGLIDVAVPIIIDEEHVANLFSGQFFFEKPDREFFENQAKRYQFDNTEYINALNQVPVVSEEKVKTVMDFLLNMTQLISDMTIQKLEQVELNEALKRSEERWQFAVEGNGDGLWDWNYQTNEVFFSKQWKQMLGFEDYEFPNKFEEWDKRIHPDDKVRAYADIKNHTDGITNVYTNEHRLLCKDGSYKWIITRGQTISRTDDNKPLRIIGIHTDITERKEAEESILKSKNRLEYALNRIDTGAWELDLVKRDAWRSFEHDKIFGYSEPLEEWTYDMFLEHVVPEDREMVNEKFQKAISTKTDWTFECRINRKDGDVRWIFGNGNHEVDKSKEVTKMFGIVQDITERKLAEVKLKVSEEKFRLLYNNSPDMFVSASPDDATIVLCNDTLLKETGYTKDEVVGAPIFKMYHDDCMDEVKKVFAQFIETGEIKNKELILKRKDGSKIEVSLNVDAIKDETGKILYSMSSWRNITEQKKTKELLLKSEARFRKMFNNATFGMIICEIIRDKNGKAIDYVHHQVNDAFKIQLGVDPKDVIGKRCSEIISEDQTNYLVENFDRVVRTGQPFEYIKYFAEFDRTVDDRSFHLEDDYFAVIFFDITEKIKNEEVIRESEEKFKLSFQSNPVAQSILTLDGIFVESNLAFSKLMGFSRKEIIGKTTADLGLFSKEEQNKLAAHANASGGSISNALAKFKTRDGGILDILYSTEPIVLNGIPHRLSMGIDVTEQKRAEQELKKHQDQLEELVKGRTEKLAEKNEELERMNKLFIGRELKMVELKEEIKKLKNEA